MTEEKESNQGNKGKKIKCPECGSSSLNLPEDIEKRDGKFYIKGTDLELHTLPDPAYICGDCGRNISSGEVFRLLS